MFCLSSLLNGANLFIGLFSKVDPSLGRKVLITFRLTKKNLRIIVTVERFLSYRTFIVFNFKIGESKLPCFA